MPFPFLAAAGISAGANVLSNLLSPGKSEFTAADLRELLRSTRRSGVDAIQTGVGQANQTAAAQAAQAGISSPNYLTRMVGLNEMSGGQQIGQLDAQLAQQSAQGQMQIGGQNLQAGQARAANIGNTFGFIADPLAQMATLQYAVNDPTMLSLLRGEV